jgi:O-antigen ligase/polysaccharide polymerase Wzy-like membrane protein
MDFAFVLLIAFAVFVVVFVKTEFGLYLVIFSMLLSPEFVTGSSWLAEGRRLVIRSEDLILLVVAFSWLAKTSVNKELGLTLKTPLNRPIVWYIVVTAIATLLGYATGTVKGAGGFLYVLKYTEYFVVYYMVANNLSDRPQAWRLVGAAFLTAAIVSVMGAAQIPFGERVSAPFEGTEGEPNTLGGYLILMIALAGGIALETQRLRIRAVCLALVGLMALPFIYTLSRTSFLAIPFAFIALGALSSRRRVVMAAGVLLVVVSPLIVAMAPKPVVSRILYTFEPEAGQATVKLGGVALDPSTSARLINMRQAFDAWIRRPILGHGVTGTYFMDVQYARTLAETGSIGFVAFLWLMWSTLKSGLGSFRTLRDPEERGLALGFLAGTVALLVHAIGANTFIIVRIMEPFWFFAAIVVTLPGLAEAQPSVPPARPSAPPARPGLPLARQWRRVA